MRIWIRFRIQLIALMWIRMRIRIQNFFMRIRLFDADVDPDSDPQHWLIRIFIIQYTSLRLWLELLISGPEGCPVKMRKCVPVHPDIPKLVNNQSI
jgi:hypothetical protein